MAIDPSWMARTPGVAKLDPEHPAHKPANPYGDGLARLRPDHLPKDHPAHDKRYDPNAGLAFADKPKAK